MNDKEKMLKNDFLDRVFECPCCGRLVLKTVLKALGHCDNFECKEPSENFVCIGTKK